MNKLKITLLLSCLFVFIGCESSCTNNPKDNNNTVDENTTLPPIGDENITNPIEDEQNNTNLRCYFIYDEKNRGFIDGSNLVKSSSTDIVLGGNWSNSTLENSTQNHFILKSINNIEVNETDIDNILTQNCKDTNENSDYMNIRYMTSESGEMYEYPILTSTQSGEIVTKYKSDIFNYKKILRYAYAVSYLYSDNNNTSNTNNTIADDIFLIDNKVLELDRIDDNISNQYLAVAIEVPKVTDDNLDNEIIIAYRGKDNSDTPISDSEIESGYDFYTKITTKYPPCKSSYSKEFDDIQSDKECYNVVLTGEKMGALIAMGVAQRTGITTRVFYAFGDDLLKSYSTKFGTFLRLDNIINFYTSDIGLVESSGEHLENMVKFLYLENRYINSIDGLIEEVLEPLYIDSNKKEPIDIYILPSTTLGAGLRKRVDIWGVVK